MRVLVSGLAHDGYYWGDFTGTLGGVAPFCTLSGDGGTMTVYEVTSGFFSAASPTCAGEEANGWVSQ